MFKFVLLIAVLIAGAACGNTCKKCFKDLGPFKCSMLVDVQSCLDNDANCKDLSNLIGNGCSSADTYVKVYKVYWQTGIDVYNSFMGIGDRSTWNLPSSCLDTCRYFYRSDLMDLWEDLPIYEVNFSIEGQYNELWTLSFDGRNTTRTNWFTAKRLKTSPWDDLTKDGRYYFSIKGFAGIRRFYIAKKHSTCSSEYGWVSVVEGQRWCDHAKFDSYPRMMVSGLAGATLWSKEYKDAVSIAVSIKLIQ